MTPHPPLFRFSPRCRSASTTISDVCREGFHVVVVREAISGVEAEPGDSEKALEKMAEKGAEIVSIEDLRI
jgi:nicotinamidase-related amidase